MELLDRVTKRTIEPGEIVRNRVTGSIYTFESVGRDSDGVFVRVCDKRGQKLVLPLSHILNADAA